MKIAGFQFAEGVRFQSGPHPEAGVVGSHIELLRAKYKGEITPEDILSDARNGNSPLHSFFEWDDSAAAHQHRLQQARGLIRAVVAIYTREDEGKPAVRQKAYVHIAQGDTSHYRETHHALSQRETREIVMKRAWAELQQWRRRYANLSEFADIVTVIDAAEPYLRKAG